MHVEPDSRRPSPPPAPPARPSIWLDWGPWRVMGLAGLLILANFSCQIVVHSFAQGLFLPVVAGAVCGVLLPLFLIVRAGGFPFRDDFLLGPVPALELLLSGLLAVAALAPTSLLAEFSMRLHPPDAEWIALYAEHFDLHAGNLLLAILGGVILAPLVEELVFRGLIQRQASRTWGPVPAVIVSGLVFGLVHGEPWYLLGLIGVGFVLGFVFEATGSLWACWLAHAVHNAISLWAIYARGGDMGRQSELRPADWILAAGSLVGIAVLGRLLVAARRRRRGSAE